VQGRAAAIAMITAIVVAVALPVASLRLVTTVATCCCPDPTDCHCPHDAKQTPDAPTMRTCHRSETTVVSPELPAFEPPITESVPPTRVVASPAYSIPAPHPAPSLERPAAPS
jgi:hypothetical protein